jgi:hypothetical protein
MLESLPIYIYLFFGFTTFLTLWLFFTVLKISTFESTREKSTLVLLCLIGWLLIQAILSYFNVYNSDTEAFPPKIVLFGILPTILLIISVFLTQKGRTFIDNLALKNLLTIHFVRIPVEVVLYWLFLEKKIPELMTFEGRNWDIIIGFSAIFIYVRGFQKQRISAKLMLVWNVIGLGFLINIVGNALLSSPSPIQQFAFEQPNIAILYFPFSWLPTFIVPIVLFAHLASIRLLLKKQKTKSS